VTTCTRSVYLHPSIIIMRSVDPVLSFLIRLFARKVNADDVDKEMTRHRTSSVCIVHDHPIRTKWSRFLAGDKCQTCDRDVYDCRCDKNEEE